VDWRRSNAPARVTTSVQVMPIKTRPLPPLAVLHELFEYQDGNLVRKKTTSQNAQKGQIAGTNSNGYIIINIKRAFYRVHRIIWYMHTEVDPVNLIIDHIDGNPLNNRIQNLRICEQKDNCKNSVKSARNTSGYKGVNLHKHPNQWRARIRHDGKYIHIGIFDTPEEAHRAYMQEDIKLRQEYSVFNRNP